MFGFLVVAAAAAPAGLDCFVCANKFVTEPVTKNAVSNTANIVTTGELNLDFMRNFLSCLRTSNGRARPSSAKAKDAEEKRTMPMRKYILRREPEIRLKA